MIKFFGLRSNKPASPPPASKSSPVAETAKPPSLVGRWKEPNADDITEFRDDGTVIERPASGEPIRGRYSLDGPKLKVKLDGAPDDLSFSISIKQDTLEMTYPDGQVTVYRRA